MDAGIEDQASAGNPATKVAQATAIWWLITGLFLFSGLSSLMYQVLWMRQLEFLFGATVLATSTVLAIFMGGLALGAYIAAQFVDRIRNQFFWYGILEGIIGIWALLAPFLFAMFTPVYQYSWQHWHVSPFTFNLIRVFAAAVVLLPPTTCMGATLPLLARFITSSLENIGDRVGVLYSVNTVGAVIGTILAGFILLPGIGIQATTITAAATNFALCAAVMIWYKLNKSAAANITAELMPTTPTTPIDAPPLPWQMKVIIVLFGLSGAYTMIYEVAWTRSLLMVIGSTTYTFSLMLSAFLVGIVGGSFICSKFIDRQKNPFIILASLELAAAAATILGMWCFARLPYWNLQLNGMFLGVDGANNFIRFFLSGLILMPLTMCLGALFPAVVKVCTSSVEKVGHTVGTVYAANTIGAIGGALLAGFYLIPNFGTESTLLLCGLGNLIIGVIIMAIAPQSTPIFRCAAALILILSAMTAQYWPHVWDKLAIVWAQPLRRHLTKQKVALIEPTFDSFLHSIHRSADLLFYKEGLGSNVAIIRTNGDVISLVTNGHVDASNTGDMQTQQMLGYLPMAVHKDPKAIGIVGWGSGVTTGTVEQFPSATLVKTIELEPLVLEASRFFDADNGNARDDRRSVIESNDGRNYLLATSDKFDVIVSEPSNPWQVGVCNLFTREYFQIAHDRLNDKGIFAIWLQCFEVQPKNTTEVLAAAHSIFPHTLTFLSSCGQANLVVLCSDSPMKISYQRLIQLSQLNRTKTGKQRLKFISSPELFMAQLALTDDGLDRLVQGAEQNTDDRNMLQYDIAKTYEEQNFYFANMKMLAQNLGDPYTAVDWGNMDKVAITDTMAKIAEQAASTSKEIAMKWIASAMSHGTKTPELYRIAGILQMLDGKEAAAERQWQTALDLSPGNPTILLTRADYFASSGNPEKAKVDLQQILLKDPQNKVARCTLARLYAPHVLGVSAPGANLDAPMVLKYLGNLPDDAEFVKQYPIVLFLAAEAKYKTGKIGEAGHLIDRYLTLVPKSVSANRFAGTIHAEQGDRLAAAYRWRQSFLLAQAGEGAPKVIDHARALLATGKVNPALDQLRLAAEFDPGNPKVRFMLTQLAVKNPRAATLLKELEGFEKSSTP